MTEMLPKISACMMVKNEEELLPQCLESIKDWVDEIIIVDNGSTDRTIEIAHEYGAKVYEHPWQNDFSLHRNQSIGYATGDWVLIIDADEKLIPEFDVVGNPFKQWLAGVPERFAGIAIKSCDMKAGEVYLTVITPRIFRRDLISYQEIVHNQPQVKGDTLCCNLLSLQHYGYDLSDEKKAAKYKRTHDLLMKRITENPNDYEAYFYLCQISGSHGYIWDAIRYGEQYLKEKSRMNGDFKHDIYFALATIHGSQNNWPRAESLIEEGLKEIPDDPDLNYLLTELGTIIKKREMVIRGGKGYMEAYQKVKNEALKRSRFYFSLNEKCMAKQLFRYSLACLNESLMGIRYLQQIKELWPDEIKDGMTQLSQQIDLSKILATQEGK